MMACSLCVVLCLIVTTLFRNGKTVIIDGHSLSVPALVATARHNAQVNLNGSTEIRARIQTSRDVITAKVETSKSVYGVSTGFGGSGKPDYGFRLFRWVLTRVPASGYSHAQHPGPGKRVVATPACWHPPFVHRCAPFPSPSGPHGVHQHAGVLGPRRNTRSHQFPDKGSFRCSMGTHRKNGRSPSCQHHTNGTSPRQHFLFRRYSDLVSVKSADS